MARYKLLVMTKPVEGRDREYNDWYQNVHLPDLVAIPGVKAAQRFRLALPIIAGAERLPFVAIYDIETDDIGAVMKELTGRAADGRMVISDAMSKENFGGVYEEFGALVTAAD